MARNDFGYAFGQWACEKPLEDLREGAEEQDDGGAPHNMDIRERRVLDVFCRQRDRKKRNTVY